MSHTSANQEYAGDAESETAKRRNTTSVLDLAIEGWNDEVDRVTAPMLTSHGAHHADVSGYDDRLVSNLHGTQTAGLGLSSATQRLDLLRQRVLGRIVGKMQRLSTT